MNEKPLKCMGCGIDVPEMDRWPDTELCRLCDCSRVLSKQVSLAKKRTVRATQKTNN